MIQLCEAAVGSRLESARIGAVAAAQYRGRIGDGVAKGAYSKEELEQVTAFRVELQRVWHVTHETDPQIDPALLQQRLGSLRAQCRRKPLSAFGRRMKRAVAKAEMLEQKR